MRGRRSKRSTTDRPGRLATRLISIRLPESLLHDLKKLASRMDVPYQSLMKVYLSERVDREIRSLDG